MRKNFTPNMFQLTVKNRKCFLFGMSKNNFYTDGQKINLLGKYVNDF